VLSKTLSVSPPAFLPPFKSEWEEHRRIHQKLEGREPPKPTSCETAVKEQEANEAGQQRRMGLLRKVMWRDVFLYQKYNILTSGLIIINM